jgi:dTDP-L-rhamnose 4-epimerase
VADLTLARRLLGFQPSTAFETGLARFLGWAQGTGVGRDDYEASLRELRAKGLMHG